MKLRTFLSHKKKYLLLNTVRVGVVFTLLFVIGFSTVFALLGSSSVAYNRSSALSTSDASSTATADLSVPKSPVLDVVDYNKRMIAMANYKALPVMASSTTMYASSTVVTASSTLAARRLWPTNAVLPEAGAILPFSRIVAYYGNFYSKGMGILGEYPEDEVLRRLASTSAMWQRADPSTPVIQAIDYIAVTAQASPGKEGKYILRMPDDQVQKAIDMAAKVHGLVFLEVQPGLSTVQKEVPLLEQFLKLPQVELSLDPEFAMHGHEAPGTVIGTLDAADINSAANYLAALVTKYHLPPKILIVHRFTQDMITHYRQIKPLPQVQIVMDMDGWGSQAKKIGTYNAVIYAEPVQFTGFKLFYKNDVKPPSTGLFSPAQVLRLIPRPLFIQYQ